MKKALRIANAEAARILLIQARELHDIAFAKLRDAYYDDFPKTMTSADIHPFQLNCFAVEKLSHEGTI